MDIPLTNNAANNVCVYKNVMMKSLEDNNTLLLWLTITIIPLLKGNGAFGREERRGKREQGRKKEKEEATIRPTSH